MLPRMCRSDGNTSICVLTGHEQSIFALIPHSHSDFLTLASNCPPHFTDEMAEIQRDLKQHFCSQLLNS